MIHISNLNKTFGSSKGLSHINLHVAPGEMVALIGSSGSGKSTLVNEILYKPLAAALNGARSRPGQCEAVEGMEWVDKVIGIILPISAFVAAGFEHCVANMFFLFMGLAQNLAGVGAAGAVDPAGIAFNLVVVTLGNIVGGVIVAGVYWFLLGTRRGER